MDKPNDEQPARVSRWYLLYFALAAFDLLTVAVSLTLNHNLIGLFADSVAGHEVSSRRLEAVAQLRQLAAATNAPGNDVFDSRDGPTEARKLELAFERFQVEHSALRTILVREPVQARRAQLLERHAQVAVAMRGMVEEARRIFALFGAGDPDAAGRRMATMDRRFAAVNAAFGRLEFDIRAHQIRDLSAQRALAENLRETEYVIAGFMLLMVAGALVYGRRVYTGMSRANAERNALVAELRRARDDALAAARAKAQFLANMSHEIRTPMHGVMGMTELLTRTRLDSNQQRYVGSIRSAADNLLVIINDILDFSKIEAGKVEIDTHAFDLCELVETTMATFAESANGKRVELACDYPVATERDFLGDSVRIRQVLTNLIGNAVKFTEQGEVSVHVRVMPAEGDARRVRIEIRDTGIGMSEATIGRIFDPFTQADNSSTRRFGGTGLGLTITRQLLDMMQAPLQVESAEGRGSVFSFEMRLECAAEDETHRISKRRSLVGARVLVVDDNATNREILETQLLGWGALVQGVTSGALALDALDDARRAGTPFTLAVLDHDMPGMTGIELARRLAADLRFDALPLVMLSSVLNTLQPEELRAIGIRAYLEKPSRQDHLLRTLQEALGSARVVPASPEDTADALPTEISATNMRVLVAEDSLVNRLLIEEHLRALGYDYEMCEDGAAACAALAAAIDDERAFGIVLMDCHMPVLDGFASTRKIREAEARRGRERVPILALTANAMSGDRDRCIEAGMDDYLSKPFTLEQLDRMLRRWRPAIDTADWRGLLGSATANASLAAHHTTVTRSP